MEVKAGVDADEVERCVKERWVEKWVVERWVMKRRMVVVLREVEKRWQEEG